jgi:hypothetical protein
MLESESRYLPVLTDPVSLCADVQTQANNVISDRDSCQSALTFDGQDMTKSVVKNKKIASVANERVIARSSTRRVVANFSKSASDSQSVADAVKLRDGNSQLLSQSDVVKPQAAETADVHSAVSDNNKQTIMSAESAKVLPTQTSLPADSTKVTSMTNDAVKSEPVMYHTKTRRQPQARTDSSLSSQYLGEGRRLLKNVIKKSPGRRDESGLLLATSSSLYTPEKYRNTMRQIFGESCTDDGKLHMYDAGNHSQQMNRVNHQPITDVESKFGFGAYICSDVCLPACVSWALFSMISNSVCRCLFGA